MEESTLKSVSTIISAITITSCLFLKVPQIRAVKDLRTAEGVALKGLIMEFAAFSIMTVYNYVSEYSILTYLEYPIILIQEYILMYYVFLYRGLLHRPLMHAVIVTYVAIVIGFLSGLLPKFLLACMVPLCTPLSGTSKVFYALNIVKKADASGVSPTTWIISVLTNLSRIFTVYVDSGDIKLMFNFLVSSILSASILTLTIYYNHYYFAPNPLAPATRRRKPSYHQHSENMHND